MASLASLGSFEETGMGQMALEKAKELFNLCDKEEKGFIIKRDMQRLQNELPGLTPDQLEEVFDSLDQDKNGFLTMEEFIKGFGMFLGLQIPDDDMPGPTAEPASLADELNQAGEEPVVEQEQFQELLENIGASEVFQNQEAALTLWDKLRKDDPNLLKNFEDFLSNVSGELKKTKDDFSALEDALQQRSSVHDAEVRRLYEEMETQIRQEKERVAAEERARAQREKEEMEREMEEKDQQLQELIKKHNELERKISDVHSTKTLTEQENEQLMKEREAFDQQKATMESELERMQQSFKESKDQLDLIKAKTKEERKERAKASFKVTEGIANERETLVKQLEALRTVNKKLQDERDEIRVSDESTTGARNQAAAQDKEIIGPYLKGTAGEMVDKAMARDPLAVSASIEEDYEVDDEFIPGSVSDVEGMQRLHQQAALDAQLAAASTHGGSLMAELQYATVAPPGAGLAAEMLLANGAVDSRPRSPRAQPVGGNEVFDSSPTRLKADEDQTPDRIFKVVFVGDSGVGKTCFLHRFCHDRFKPTFNATIGVDFTVKSILVGDRLVALQLWDTAGQERFRSITKQYFRKADGVVLVYDVTAESSFINLRNWIQSVREGVDDSCVLCIVGNKLDLVESEETRIVTSKDGERLADEYNTLFFECSANSGQGIPDCMRAMAVHLQEREDQHLEDALRLGEPTEEKKKSCCGR